MRMCFVSSVLLGHCTVISRRNKVSYLFSGRRWNVVSVDRTDATSFWVVKRERANSSIIYLKNNSTERYLGMLDNFLFSNWLEMQCSRFLCGILTFVRHFLYILTGLDGTYVYTKTHHFCAEKWRWEGMNETSNRGHLFATFTGKYLTVRNGTLWSVSSRSQDSIWYLESV